MKEFSWEYPDSEMQAGLKLYSYLCINSHMFNPMNKTLEISFTSDKSSIIVTFKYDDEKYAMGHLASMLANCLNNGK